MRTVQGLQPGKSSETGRKVFFFAVLRLENSLLSTGNLVFWKLTQTFAFIKHKFYFWVEK